MLWLRRRNGIQWTDTSTALCGGINSTACPLAVGRYTVASVTSKKLMPGTYDAKVSTNGIIPGTPGLHVLACTGTLSFAI